VAVLSGRRALWLVMALTPCTLLTLAVLARCSVRFGRATVRSLWMYAVLGAFAGMFAVVAPEVLPETGFVAHLQEAFSSVDERTIQKPFLLQAFAEEPVLGSGFGAAAGYLRNYERPWTGYELTYHQMLFNLGIVGSTMLAAVFVSYVVMVILLLRRYGEWGAIPFALLLGCVSLLMGAYSNRYFGSFDYLFFVGILPYLATFTRGFHEGSPGRAVSG
jgi:hypothetical protein